jgi:hypothetical protein
MDRFKLWAGIALITGWCLVSVTDADPGVAATPATSAQAGPAPWSPSRPSDSTPTSFAGARTAPDAKPTAQPPAEADARIRLCKAREHYYAGELDVAQLMAGQLKQMRNLQWGYFEDSPDKLLYDIDQARARRNQEASAHMLAEARTLMAQGKLGEAEQRARDAAALYHAPAFFARGDTAEKAGAWYSAAASRALCSASPSLP